MSKNINSLITSQFLKLLDQGIIPWRTPVPGGAPFNCITGRRYGGVNFFLLGFARRDSNPSRVWVRRQDLRWHHPDGEAHREPAIVLVGPCGNEPAGPREATLGYQKVFNVYNFHPAYDHERYCDLLGLCGDFAAVDRMVRGYLSGQLASAGGQPPGVCRGPRLRRSKEPAEAFYLPPTDEVVISDRETFSDRDHYYSALFYSLALSTGHARRFDRLRGFQPWEFGTCKCGFQELVAEMATAILCSLTGVKPFPIPSCDTVRHIDAWSAAIRQHGDLLLKAGEASQDAVNLILGEYQYLTRPPEQHDENDVDLPF